MTKEWRGEAGEEYDHKLKRRVKLNKVIVQRKETALSRHPKREKLYDKT